MTDQEIHLCTYCNQPATYQFKNDKWCCSPHMNGCPEIKKQRKEHATKQWKETKDLGFSKLNENIKENNFTPTQRILFQFASLSKKFLIIISTLSSNSSLLIVSG
jgi:hypothetical protein